MFSLIAAIDLRGGRGVRLREGRADTEHTVTDDPVATAQKFEAEGAHRLHLVDLDGAFDGAPAHESLIATLVRSVSLPVEVGGGLRTREAVRRVFEAGAQFAILGTMVLEDPEQFRALAEAFPGRIIAGLDAKDGRVATRGWTKASDVSVEDAAAQAVAWGAAEIITTDIAHDGMGQGMGLDSVRRLAATERVPIIASGGARHLDDLRAAADAGAKGAVLGRALYDGTLSLTEARRWADGR